MSLPYQKDLQAFSRAADALTHSSLSEYRTNKKIFESLMPEQACDYMHHHVTRFRTTRDYSLEPYLSTEVLHSKDRLSGFRVLVFSDERCALERIKAPSQTQKIIADYDPSEEIKARVESLVVLIMQEYTTDIDHIRIEYTPKFSRLAFIRNILTRQGRKLFAAVEYVASASNKPVFRSPNRY